MTQVYLGIGSNIDRDNNIRTAIVALAKKFGELVLSSVYESQAYGFEGDNFYNLVAGFKTDLSISELSRWLRELEISFGRQKDSERFLSRTIDLDLLLYGDLVQHDETCHVPREDITQYAFVLCPLAEVAPSGKHPESGETYAGLWQSFSDNNQSVWRVEFNFSNE